jgi:hypothetical protein
MTMSQVCRRRRRHRHRRRYCCFPFFLGLRDLYPRISKLRIWEGFSILIHLSNSCKLIPTGHWPNPCLKAVFACDNPTQELVVACAPTKFTPSRLAH